VIKSDKITAQKLLILALNWTSWLVAVF